MRQERTAYWPVSEMLGSGVVGAAGRSSLGPVSTLAGRRVVRRAARCDGGSDDSAPCRTRRTGRLSQGTARDTGHTGEGPRSRIQTQGGAMRQRRAAVPCSIPTRYGPQRSHEAGCTVRAADHTARQASSLVRTPPRVSPVMNSDTLRAGLSQDIRSSQTLSLEKSPELGAWSRPSLCLTMPNAEKGEAPRAKILSYLAGT